MKLETERYLAKARQMLGEARTAAGVDLADAAGRASYLAAFHAAQALIFERSGKASKTHRGVHIQFARLTKNEPSVSPELREFCPSRTIRRPLPITRSGRTPPCRWRRQWPQSAPRSGSSIASPNL